jgi:hypothetical protein
MTDNIPEIVVNTNNESQRVGLFFSRFFVYCVLRTACFCYVVVSAMSHTDMPLLQFCEDAARCLEASVGELRWQVPSTSVRAFPPPSALAFYSAFVSHFTLTFSSALSTCNHNDPQKIPATCFLLFLHCRNT